jgi:hypothetical protein
LEFRAQSFREIVLEKGVSVDGLVVHRM